MHPHDLFGDGETQASAALGLRHRAVHPMELLEDTALLIKRYAGARVCHRDGEIAVAHDRGDAHLVGVGELDGVADEV